MLYNVRKACIRARRHRRIITIIYTTLAGGIAGLYGCTFLHIILIMAVVGICAWLVLTPNVKNYNTIYQIGKTHD